MRLLILGISGSIGRQCVDVINKDKERFDLVAFSLGDKTRYITPLLKKFPHVKHVCVKSPIKQKEYQKKYPNITFYSGDNGLLKLIENSNPDMVVNALVGFVGLCPTIKALSMNKIIALANKESLVVGGELVNDLLRQGKGKLYPIDSEHVALAKCLSVDDKNVDKLIITASGGSFRNLKREELTNVTKEDALRHPNWKMGEKITIDSATMVNKCFEIIEAHYLFNYPRDKIDVILHDESMIHSMVKYKNGLIRADISKPDMRVPIKYALYESLIPFKTYQSDDMNKFGPYHFHEFDIKRYPVIKYADEVINKKGLYGTILNASNEVAVYAFLRKEIPFLKIEECIDHMMRNVKNISHPTLEEILDCDKKVRKMTLDYIKGGKK